MNNKFKNWKFIGSGLEFGKGIIKILTILLCFWYCIANSAVCDYFKEKDRGGGIEIIKWEIEKNSSDRITSFGFSIDRLINSVSVFADDNLIVEGSCTEAHPNCIRPDFSIDMTPFISCNFDAYIEPDLQSDIPVDIIAHEDVPAIESDDGIEVVDEPLDITEFDERTNEDINEDIENYHDEINNFINEFVRISKYTCIGSTIPQSYKVQMKSVDGSTGFIEFGFVSVSSPGFCSKSKEWDECNKYSQ